MATAITTARFTDSKEINAYESKGLKAGTAVYPHKSQPQPIGVKFWSPIFLSWVRFKTPARRFTHLP